MLPLVLGCGSAKPLLIAQSDKARPTGSVERQLFLYAVSIHGIYYGRDVPERTRKKIKASMVKITTPFAEMHATLADEMEALLLRYPDAPAEEREAVRRLAENNRMQAKVLFSIHNQKLTTLKGTPELARMKELDREQLALLKRFETPLRDLVDGIGLQPTPNTRVQSDAAGKSEEEAVGSEKSSVE